jgi:exodeoxyribonuclease VII small subunit
MPTRNLPKPEATPPAENFEQAVAEIEQIVRKLESGQPGLEESITLYERGSTLLKFCRGVLGEAEKKIATLSKNADGSVDINPPGEGRGDGRPIE